MPSWKGDAKYYADALDWMVDESEKLPKGMGIKVVSVSAAPSGKGSPFVKNGDAWDAAVKRAAASGILVLDCSADTGRIDSCYLHDPDPEDPTNYKGGYPGVPYSAITSRDPMRAPTSFRSTAEACVAGSVAWQYSGRGGLSWAIPWAAGVLAMGWQLDPFLGAKKIMKLLDDSSFVNLDGERIIDPKAFILAVRKGRG